MSAKRTSGSLSRGQLPQPTSSPRQHKHSRASATQFSARAVHDVPRKRNAACRSAVQSVIPCGVPCLQNLATTCGMGDDRMRKSGKSPPLCQAACPLHNARYLHVSIQDTSRKRRQIFVLLKRLVVCCPQVARAGTQDTRDVSKARPSATSTPRFPPTGHVQKTNTGSNRGNTSENVRQSSVDSKLRRCSVVTNLGQHTDSEFSAHARTHTKHTHSS